ncbi:MAG: glycoside hydrolase [Mucilaginibacter sp.]|nr:glycoside hydrolase [Mucilaginibacter sp.]
MSKKLFTTAALVCCFIICLAAVVADLSGKWTGVVKTPEGQDVTLTYIMKVDGDTLTGTGEANGNTVTINEGKINGNDFTFKITDTEGLVIPHSGKFYPEADSVSMNIDYNGTKMHTTLKRDK